MQEDVERRTVALSVNASKLTGRILAKAFLATVHKIQREQQKSQTPQGKQSVRKLMNHGVSTNSLPLTGETRLFDRIARKHNVDYAFHKTGPKTHLLFFKAGQADAIIIDVSEEIANLLYDAERKEQNSMRRIYWNKAHYSLDAGDGIENDALFPPDTPSEILEQRQEIEKLYLAISSLPQKQCQRIYAHFILGYTQTEIAEAENVRKSSISESIQSGLQKLKEILQKSKTDPNF